MTRSKKKLSDFAACSIEPQTACIGICFFLEAVKEARRMWFISLNTIVTKCKTNMIFVASFNVLGFFPNFSKNNLLVCKCQCSNREKNIPWLIYFCNRNHTIHYSSGGRRFRPPCEASSFWVNSCPVKYWNINSNYIF